MNAQELEAVVLEHVFVYVREMGVGVDYLEPIVVMGKIQRTRVAPGVEQYAWMHKPILHVRREKNKDGGRLWTILTIEGESIASYEETVKCTS
jgi:hypothetical protein